MSYSGGGASSMGFAAGGNAPGTFSGSAAGGIGPGTFAGSAAGSTTPGTFVGFAAGGTAVQSPGCAAGGPASAASSVGFYPVPQQAAGSAGRGNVW